MNKNSNLLVISSYPSKGHIHDVKVVGIASYTKNTLLSLKKNYKNLKITVLAEVLNQEEEYKDKNINIIRLWRRNSFLIFPLLIKEIILKHKKKKKILIEFELAMFGSLIYLLPFPIFVMILKLFRKDLILVLHQVIPDINEMHGHINIERNSLTAHSINFLIYLFYLFILKTTSKIIVFEEVLKERLKKIDKNNKIFVIPHGVENFKKLPTKAESRKMLNLSKDKFILLYFGFIAWYKGIDLLVDIFKKTENKKQLLLIAGGPNPNHLNKSYYRQYVNIILKQKDSRKIKTTGFIPEEKIPYYFQAADLVVFPYRTFMSSSGPLSMAFSFKKPFLLSKNLKDILKTKDTKQVLSNLRINKDYLCFENHKDFKRKTNKIQKDFKFRKKITMLSAELAEKRCWNFLAKNYYEAIS